MCVQSTRNKFNCIIYNSLSLLERLITAILVYKSSSLQATKTFIAVFTQANASSPHNHTIFSEINLNRNFPSTHRSNKRAFHPHAQNFNINLNAILLYSRLSLS
jgi:hypothetical protein